MSPSEPTIPAQFSMALVDGLGESLKVLEVSRTFHFGVGLVFVRLFKSGACPSQLHELGGKKGPDK